MPSTRLFSHKNAAGSPLRKGWEESGSWELERKEKGYKRDFKKHLHSSLE